VSNTLVIRKSIIFLNLVHSIYTVSKTGATIKTAIWYRMEPRCILPFLEYSEKMDRECYVRYFASVRKLYNVRSGDTVG